MRRRGFRRQWVVPEKLERTGRQARDNRRYAHLCPDEDHSGNGPQLPRHELLGPYPWISLFDFSPEAVASIRWKICSPNSPMLSSCPAQAIRRAFFVSKALDCMNAAKSSAARGRLMRYPCTASRPWSASMHRWASVLTPSASVAMCKERPSAVTAFMTPIAFGESTSSATMLLKRLVSVSHFSFRAAESGLFVSLAQGLFHPSRSHRGAAEVYVAPQRLRRGAQHAQEASTRRNDTIFSYISLLTRFFMGPPWCVNRDVSIVGKRKAIDNLPCRAVSASDCICF